jgi:YbbR domain-containing protein
VVERLRHNLGLKALALALAVGAWAYLRFAANPAIAAHFDEQLSVPIVTTGLPPDQIVRYPDKQTVVTIVTPRDTTTPVRPDDIRAVLNLASHGPGVYSIPITVIAPRLEVRSVTPASETLQIERIESRRVPVTVRYTGGERGVVVGRVPMVPSTVQIRGATSDLARVASVRVDVPIPAQPRAQTYDAMVRAAAVDVKGGEVSGVQATPNLVRVRVAFGAPRRIP